jgi:hypothetical protein
MALCFQVCNCNNTINTLGTIAQYNTLNSSGNENSKNIRRRLPTVIIGSLLCIGQISKINDSGFAAHLQSLLEKIPQPQIGRYGQIQEWADDYEEVEPGSALLRSALFSKVRV